MIGGHAQYSWKLCNVTHPRTGPEPSATKLHCQRPTHRVRTILMTVESSLRHIWPTGASDVSEAGESLLHAPVAVMKNLLKEELE